ncbi:hypothetical protein Bpfe_024616 [Biomphalaria pfeifferi]|uniref:Uncharacterized protein n=1 Tax=Biomphalaria pfeifferi TaxID=112525 RepID=A0AAD8EZ73_BIOPF|nr:hypothetical protein Bpfe_024616 [Biomphalaria pfeifferi]
MNNNVPDDAPSQSDSPELFVTSSTSLVIVGYDVHTLSTILTLLAIAAIYLYNVNLVVLGVMILIIVVKCYIQKYLHPTRRLSDLPDIR